MPRLFVGIDFPPAVKDLLFQLCTGLREAWWIEPERFHLTLRFIGAVDDAATNDIATTLQAIKASAFRLTLVGVGRFRQHTLWVGVEPNPALMSLRDKIERALQ